MMIFAAVLSSVVGVAPGNEPLARDVVGVVAAEACKRDVEALAGFGTRHSLSDVASRTRGIGAARGWLVGELERVSKKTGGRLKVSVEAWTQPPTPNKRVLEPTEMANVVAVLPGTEGEGGRRYYVVGHYDSRNGDQMDAAGDAPGANDDASGCAVVLACARALAAMPPMEGTVVFLLTQGEEQGLLGAVYHAESAAARGEQILGVLSNDIVGDPSAPEGSQALPTVGGRGLVRVFSEGLPRALSVERLAELRKLSAESDSPSRQLARYVAEVGRREGAGGGLGVQAKLVFRLDRFLRGGDHMAFLDAGFPAVRFTEVDEDYSRQHQNVVMVDGKRTGDVPEFVDAGYVADIAKLNAATLWHLANAPSGPRGVRVLTKELENVTRLKWEPSPEADVAGYEVVWRETTAAEWQGARDVGEATEAVVELNKDDWFFGVRAYDAKGFRSVVVFAGVGKE